jgi:hypothetical protein
MQERRRPARPQMSCPLARNRVAPAGRSRSHDHLAGCRSWCSPSLDAAARLTVARRAHGCGDVPLECFHGRQRRLRERWPADEDRREKRHWRPAASDVSAARACANTSTRFHCAPRPVAAASVRPQVFMTVQEGARNRDDASGRTDPFADSRMRAAGRRESRGKPMRSLQHFSAPAPRNASSG